VLLQTLFTQEAEFTPNEIQQTAGLTGIINNSEVGDVVIATENDEIVGMVILLYTVSTALGGIVAILEDMVVSANMRGKGIGAKILNFAFTLAKSKGCLRITLLTDNDNIPAQKFYNKHGFNHSSMIVLRKILS
jgi:GNAT superfamily N-acetyltransferase